MAGFWNRLLTTHALRNAKRALELQGRELRRLAGVVDASSDAIVANDLDGVVFSWNRGAERMYGYSRDEMIGRSVRVLVPPEGEDELAGILAHTRAGERVEQLETIRIRKDGSRLDVALTASPIAGSDGAPVGASTVSRDITAQKRAQDVLRRNQALLAEAQRLAQVGSWEWDVVADVVRWSDEMYRIFGVDAGMLSLNYRTALERAHSEDRDRLDALLRHTVESGEPFATEHRILRPDTGVRLLYVVGKPIRDEAGHRLRVVGVVQDITERRRAEEERAQLYREQAARAQAEEANRLKDEFITTLSHELRTPLNAIVGWTHLIRAGALDDETMERAVEAIERNASIQTQLIADILDLSRIASGKMHLRMQTLSLQKVVEAAVDTVRPSADAKGLTLEAHVDPDVAPVSGDPDRLQQVVWNLLSNAIKFTPRPGLVRVWLRAHDGTAEIGVQDTGVGIEPSFLPHVFERFRQADASTTRRHGGLGLGLSIVRHLSELHGGAVAAESAGAGRGATFRFTLPLLTGATGRADVTEGGTSFADAPQLNGLEILVVDDDSDSRDLLKAALETLGAEVLLAKDAAEGFGLLRERRPDVIVSDIEMPEENGYDLMRKIRALKPGDGGLTPAVALTAYARAEDRVQSLVAGYQIHIAKPVRPAELATVVARLGATVRAPISE